MHTYIMHIGGMYTCPNDCTWHMYMHKCYIHAYIYISISISELHYPRRLGSGARSSHEDFIHTYVAYILIYMWPICA